LQILVLTSDRQYHCLNPFIYLWQKYFWWSAPILGGHQIICGFTLPQGVRTNRTWEFYSIGRQEDYPADRWSDALIHVLDHVADEQFILMLEDYWLCRPVDLKAVRMLYDYARQFSNVLKIDLTTDRLYVDGGGRYLYGYNTYNTVGYVDLIKSPPGSQYQMSLWGGIWNRDVMRQFINPGERAQEVELRGTSRVNEAGESVLVLGTRQAPLIHGNIYQSGRDGPVYHDGGWQIAGADLAELRERGWVE
jgi:hypothetical protein